MNKKLLFYIKVLTLILVLFLFKKNNNENRILNYDSKHINLEECISLNIPCINYTPSLWEIERIKGLNIKQAKEIKAILSLGLQNKEDFKEKLLKIKGIGKKKSNNISGLFYY